MYDDTHPFPRYGWSLMSYIESSLSQSEKIEVTFPLHWASRLNLWACIVIGFFLMGLPWLYAIYEYYRLKNIEIAVTNKRVVLKQGIFGRYTEELKIDAIESIEIWQGVYGRMFGYGNVYITGRGGSKVALKDLDNPISVKSAIESVSQLARP